MKTVTIVGVGALGSHVVQFLRNIPATLKVIDFDKVDSGNVMSQFHSKQSVGKSKVNGLKGNVSFLYGIQLEVVPHKLTKDNVEMLLQGSSLVIDCLDNIEGRQIVQTFTKGRGIPCLHGALAAGGAYGRVVWNESFKADKEDAGVATCEDGEHLPFIAVVSSWIAIAANEFMRRGKKLSFEVSPAGAIRV